MSTPTDAKSASTETFVSALVFNVAIFAIELGVFTLLWPYFRSVYQPRTYAPPPSKRIERLASSRFLWPWAVFNADYKGIIKANGLDAYFFVRFLRLMVIILLPIWFLSWAILLPVNSVGTSIPGRTGLDRFSFGNIQSDKAARYAAHLILNWVFTGWILYNIKKEMTHFITTRQMQLIEPSHAKSTQANTILVTGVPARFLNHECLHHLFKDLPGGVKKIWINRHLKELPGIYDRRMTACAKLESAEVALLRTAAKLRKERIKKGEPQADAESAPVEAIITVPKDQRPTHRLGFFGLWGKKVDSIDWAREEIRVCSQLLNEGRKIIDQEAEAKEAGHSGKGKDAILKTMRIVKENGQESRYPPMSSAFITFNRQIAAHLAAQALLHHRPYAMSNKYTEVNPEDVIWSNLCMNPYEQKIRIALSYCATAALIIFWAIPVAFVGVISNIYTVCHKVVFLSWICTLPKEVVGIISGILPPVLLAVLMMLLPIVLRLFARFEGIPQKTGVELSLMTRFFIFQVVHSFLIVTLSSGIMASITNILNSPATAPSLLAQNLPLASTFFLTYIILQGFSGTAGGFLQIVSLIVYYVKLVLFGSTPRSVFGVKYGASSVAWGTLFPLTSLVSVIAIGYMIISPIINGLACATFFLFYLLYKYLFLWVYQQGTDTGGLFYPKALQHLFVGLYVEQVCMAALFFLSQGSDKRSNAVPEGALMVVLIVFTAFYHVIISNSYGPLEKALPLTLADKMYNPEAACQQAGPSSEAGGATSDKASSQEHFSHNILSVGSLEQLEQLAVEELEEDDLEFAPPAISDAQRTIWLPHDALGLAEGEQRACLEAGVDASVGPNATMDANGKVDVTGFPPESKPQLDVDT